MNDHDLLAECAKALSKLDSTREWDSLSANIQRIWLDRAATIIGLVRPRIEAEALERAAKLCDAKFGRTAHDHMAYALGAKDAGIEIRSLIPKESSRASTGK